MDINKIGQRISRVTNDDKQNYFDQQRNRLGGTYYPQEGLQPARGHNALETKIMQKLQNAKPDNLETRMYEEVSKHRQNILLARKKGLISNEKVKMYAFDKFGNTVEEYI